MQEGGSARVCVLLYFHIFAFECVHTDEFRSSYQELQKSLLELPLQLSSVQKQLHNALGSYAGRTQEQQRW